MSLYNLMHGVNPNHLVLRAILGIDQDRPDAPEYPKDWYPYDEGYTPAGEKYRDEIIARKAWNSGRFRDIYLDAEGTKVILFTRNGGGNRDSYMYVFDTLKEHPNYLKDYDDSFDSTYAYIEFSVPEEYQPLCKEMASGIEPKSFAEKFQEKMREIEGMTKEQFETSPTTRHIAEAMKPIIEAITAPPKDV